MARTTCEAIGKIDRGQQRSTGEVFEHFIAGHDLLLALVVRAKLGRMASAQSVLFAVERKRRQRGSGCAAAIAGAQYVVDGARAATGGAVTQAMQS